MKTLAKYFGLAVEP